MTGRLKPQDFAALHRLARLRADMEMQKFSAFRAHMTTLETRMTGLRATLLAGYRTEGAFSVATARRSHEMTRAVAQDLRRCEEELSSMRPRFEAARKQAMREMGRAEVLKQLHDQAKAEGRANRDAIAEALANGPGY